MKPAMSMRQDQVGSGTDLDYATVKYSQTEPEETHTLTVNKAGIGNGAVISSPSGVHCGADCDQRYVTGTTVTLRARPAFGSIFVGWSGCDAVSGSRCSVTMNAERSATANSLAFRYSAFPFLLAERFLV